MFYTERVSFPKITDILKIYKKRGLTVKQIIGYFSNENNIKFVQEKYEKIPPLTVKEAIAFPNAEQRALALKYFTPEEISNELKAILVDKQTIKKSHVRWDENLRPYKHEFEDTYELYKISGSVLNMKRQFSNTYIDIYFVKCKCASTNRQYYLYVPQYIGMQKDAIKAIAWTMRFGNQPLTKEQYLNLMYSET